MILNPTNGHISGEKHGLKGYTAALFTTAKTWKQHFKHQPGMDEEDAVHIYNGLLLNH